MCRLPWRLAPGCRCRSRRTPRGPAPGCGTGGDDASRTGPARRWFRCTTTSSKY